MTRTMLLILPVLLMACDEEEKGGTGDTGTPSADADAPI